MCMISRSKKPDWNKLYEIAETQSGHFTTAQAAVAGYSPQLLVKHLWSGRIARLRRGVYRLVHFPPGEHDDLVIIYLWSDRQGVFSHETALALQALSEALPAKIHLTVPSAWRSRRLRVPKGVVLHYADVRPKDLVGVGPVPVTAPQRTVMDCATANVQPDLVRTAIKEGLQRGLFTREMIVPAEEYIRRFDRRSA